MGCIYNGWEGKCSLSENEEYCSFDCDPDPADSCENYESDYYCHECGTDLNVEECQCES